MTRRGPKPIAHRTISFDVAVRLCTAEDLPNLEWFGMYTAHREIFREAYEAHERGDGSMLVADAAGFPVGQAFVDLTWKRGRAAKLWALRVFPLFEKRGLGRLLIAAAERLARSRGRSRMELGVVKDSSVRRFYERLGYRLVGDLYEEQRYVSPEGVAVAEPFRQWLMRKELGRVHEDEAA